MQINLYGLKTDGGVSKTVLRYNDRRHKKLHFTWG